MATNRDLQVFSFQAALTGLSNAAAVEHGAILAGDEAEEAHWRERVESWQDFLLRKYEEALGE